MWKLVGNSLIIFGTIWSTVSSCGLAIVGFLLWGLIFLWLITSFWGGIFWGLLWLFIGGGLLFTLVSIVGVPLVLVGSVMAALGERIKGEDDG